jgi:hypothetical protein
MTSPPAVYKFPQSLFEFDDVPRDLIEVIKFYVGFLDQTWSKVGPLRGLLPLSRVRLCDSERC